MNTAVGSETNTGEVALVDVKLLVDDGLLAAVAHVDDVDELDDGDRKYSLAIHLHFSLPDNVSYLRLNTSVGMGTDPTQTASDGGLLAGVAHVDDVEVLDEGNQKYSLAIALHFSLRDNGSYLRLNTAVGPGTNLGQAARASAALRGSEYAMSSALFFTRSTVKWACLLLDIWRKG